MTQNLLLKRDIKSDIRTHIYLRNLIVVNLDNNGTNAKLMKL
jgi:hypothetical protein